MKGRKLLSVLLALSLLLGLAAPAALAAEPTYPDVEGHWAWKQGYIQDATARGLFNGYGDGTFRPNAQVTQAIGLTLVARVLLPEATRKQILADRLQEIRELFPGTEGNPDDPRAPYSWFRAEAAVCLELGIISPEELTALKNEGRLGEPMGKAEFSMYLVRALGLEERAQALYVPDLTFNDLEKIDEAYRPYVRLLCQDGVVQGDNQGNFGPGPMNRAVCATMLCRAMAALVDPGLVSVELPRFTKYNWVAGYIRSVTPGEDGSRVLALESAVSGAHTVTVPSTAKLYQYNRLTNWTALKLGTYARVCYTGDGANVETVRLYPADRLGQVRGVCDGLTPEMVMVAGHAYTIDRFTEVQAGGKAGDSSVLDYDADYTTADVTYDGQGRVLTLALSGGTRLLEGVLSDVSTTTVGLTTRTSVTVNGYDGAPTVYAVGDDVDVVVNGELGELKESMEGLHVRLRVEDEDLSQLRLLEVDLLGQYVQGVLRATDPKAEPQKIELTLTGASRKTAYELSPDCQVLYMGSPTTLAGLQNDLFVTAKLEGGSVTLLSAWQGYEDTVGTLEDIRYGDPTVLSLKREDGSVTEISVSSQRLSEIPITQEGKTIDITKVSVGDQVVVTTLYHEVTQIDVTPQEANVSGTLQNLSFDEDGSTVLRLRFSDGSTHSYTATSGVTVTRQGNVPASLADLKVGSQVALVTHADRVMSIQITASPSLRDSLEGILYQKDDQERTLTLRVEDLGATRLVKVYVPANTIILDVVENRTSTRVSSLSVNDVLEVWGSYGSDGVFQATSIIKK